MKTPKSRVLTIENDCSFKDFSNQSGWTGNTKAEGSFTRQVRMLETQVNNLCIKVCTAPQISFRQHLTCSMVILLGLANLMLIAFSLLRDVIKCRAVGVSSVCPACRRFPPQICDNCSCSAKVEQEYPLVLAHAAALFVIYTATQVRSCSLKSKVSHRLTAHWTWC